MDDLVYSEGAQASPVMTLALEHDLAQFFKPLATWLGALLDERLTHMSVSGVVALLEWRNRAHEALVSE